jgi:flagellar biosynthetic protein FliQ
MNTGDVVEIMREAVWVMLQLGAPAMAAALLIGLSVSVLQALTQLQEATLTFVPKMVGVFVVLVISMPWAIATLVGFTQGLYDRIAGIGPT